MNHFIKSSIILVIALVGLQSRSDTGESSFTPTSFKIPIFKISIAAGDFTNEQTLYSCAANTLTGCLVDLTDSTALDAITAQANAVSIKVGVYPVINISTCPAGSSGASQTLVKATGQVTIGATTYYTSSAAGSGGISSALSSAQEAVIDTFGCTSTYMYPVAPITVTESSTQTLTLTLNISNILFTQSATSSGQGGCIAPTGGGRGICANLPFMIPYIGTGAVTVEKYYIANSSTDASGLTLADANGQLLLAIDPNGSPFYAATLPYYTNTSPSTASATKGGNTMLYGISRADMNDPTKGIDFTYDSGANTCSFLFGGDLDLNGFGVNGFQRSNHTGVTSPRTGGTSWHYKAFKQ